MDFYESAETVNDARVRKSLPMRKNTAARLASNRFGLYGNAVQLQFANDNPDVLRNRTSGFINYRKDDRRPVVQLQKSTNAVIQREPKPQQVKPDYVEISDNLSIDFFEAFYRNTFIKIVDIIKNAALTDENKGNAQNIGIIEINSGNIWESIISAFCVQDNIDIIINIMFGPHLGTPEYNFGEAVTIIGTLTENNPEIWQNIMTNIKVGITQTLNDIFYWNCKQIQHLKGQNTELSLEDILNNNKVIKIDLAGSDPHTRGIGVCIVTFASSKKLVIKPGQRDFERIIFGKIGENSLANDFNKITKPGDLNKKDVGELEIETSEDHGSAIEYFEHKQLPQWIDETDGNFNANQAVLTNTLTFASLLGLADLHVENLVYADNGKVQIIDGEVGFKYELDLDNPAATVIKKGEISTNKGFSIPKDFAADRIKYYLSDYIRKLQDFLDDNVRKKLQGQRCRIVVFETGFLYAMRNAFYKGHDIELIKEVYSNKLSEFSEKKYTGGKVEKATADIAFNYMIADFEKGVIPFFERDLDTGGIYQIFTDQPPQLIISNKSKSLDNMIDRYIISLGVYMCY